MQLTYKFSSILLSLIFTICFSSIAHVSFASEKERFNVSETIMHHIQDAHEWHITGDEHNGISVYLPVILLDNDLKIFSSKHFYHGKKVKVIGDDKKSYQYMVGVGPAKGYALYHEKIYKLAQSENQNEDPAGHLHFKKGHPHNTQPLDFSITKNVASLFFGALLVIVLLLGASRFYKSNGAVVPKGIARFIEPLILFIRDDIAKENIHHGKHLKYLPYLVTIFFFIWINNMLGLIPILPGGANLTGNITITAFLAICTLVITVFSGNKNYWKHIFFTPGVPLALLPIMIPIEIVGIFTKPFALMIRLFANITAGHIIVLALISIIFIYENATWGLLSVPMALFISVLEILVAFLQAYLFAMLSALFIGAAVDEAHH